MKPFTLYLLHSSHTDVGYTDTQEKMKFHHVAFIREVLELIEHEPRFKWNCESYWCVEQFLKEATPEETQAFVRAVKKGNIGLSASYLNLTAGICASGYYGCLYCAESSPGNSRQKRNDG